MTLWGGENLVGKMGAIVFIAHLFFDIFIFSFFADVHRDHAIFDRSNIHRILHITQVLSNPHNLLFRRNGAVGITHVSLTIAGRGSEQKRVEGGNF